MIRFEQPASQKYNLQPVLCVKLGVITSTEVNRKNTRSRQTYCDAIAFGIYFGVDYACVHTTLPNDFSPGKMFKQENRNGIILIGKA